MTQKIIVRLFNQNADVLERLIRQTRPDITLTRDPITSLENARKALICFTPPEDEPIADYDWIHSTGAGVDRILASLGHTDSPPVMTRTIGTMGAQIAEYSLFYALDWLQKRRARETAERAGQWAPGVATPDYLFDQTVGVIGTGAIGREIGKAFQERGAQVIGYSRQGQKTDDFDSVLALDSFSSRTAHSILILALPNTPQTENIINGKVLGQLKHALLVNIGRGATLDLAALAISLDAGHVEHAVLDVFPQEPLPPDHWCWSHPKVTVTPHVSGLTRPEDAADAFLKTYFAFERGEPITSMVDIERGY